MLYPLWLYFLWLYFLWRRLVVDQAWRLPRRVRQRHARARRAVRLAPCHHMRHVARQLPPRLALACEPLGVRQLACRRLVDRAEEP